MTRTKTSDSRTQKIGVLKTKLEEKEAKLKKTQKSLKKLQEQKDEFISMAAHELRAPMTAIKGYISMILQGDAGKISEKARGYLVDAGAISDRIIRLINNMLNVSRIEEGRAIYRVKRVSLSEVAKEAFNHSKLEAERKGLGFNFVVQPNIEDSVFVDPERIREVVDNLISNAIKYTNQGSVTIKIGKADKDKIRLEVIDTGPGVSEKEQKKLFRKFYRVKITVGKTIGTGLGLYICKLLIERFNGVIGLESELGKGSNFWIELPLEKEGGS